MEGTRKFKAWLLTLIANLLVFAGGLFFGGVTYTSDAISTMVLINSALSGAFFGANFGEHWAATRAANGKKDV